MMVGDDLLAQVQTRHGTYDPKGKGTRAWPKLVETVVTTGARRSV